MAHACWAHAPTSRFELAPAGGGRPEAGPCGCARAEGPAHAGAGAAFEFKPQTAFDCRQSAAPQHAGQRARARGCIRFVPRVLCGACWPAHRPSTVPNPQAAKQLALDIASGARPRMNSLTRTDKLEPFGEAAAIIDFARAEVGRAPCDPVSADCLRPHGAPPVPMRAAIPLAPAPPPRHPPYPVPRTPPPPAAGAQARAPPDAPPALPGRNRGGRQVGRPRRPQEGVRLARLLAVVAAGCSVQQLDAVAACAKARMRACMQAAGCMRADVSRRAASAGANSQAGWQPGGHASRHVRRLGSRPRRCPRPAARPQEGECFRAAAALDTHKSLVHVFFAQRATKKVRGRKEREGGTHRGGRGLLFRPAQRARQGPTKRAAGRCGRPRPLLPLHRPRQH